LRFRPSPAFPDAHHRASRNSSGGCQRTPRVNLAVMPWRWA
jgi:hypothetical protein